MAYTIVDDGAVVVKAFDASAAGHAMDSGRRPDGSAKEAEIIQISPLFNGFIEINVKILQWNRFRVSWIPAES
jgi:hypothetical protein